MNRNNKIVIFFTIIIGLVVPFIPALTVIEMFVLLVPFAVVFALTLIYLIISWIKKNLNRQKALFLFSILPIFIVSQLTSGFIVDKIQRLRSNHIITKIEKLKFESGILPEKYDIIAGIDYIKMKDSEHFVIKYSRGFMVTEKYHSENKNWRSYGWND